MKRGADTGSTTLSALPRVASSIPSGGLWVTRRTITMEKAFAQRREQVVGDLMQLKTDVDVYNDMNKGRRPPIQIELDFRDDVAERKQV